MRQRCQAAASLARDETGNPSRAIGTTGRRECDADFCTERVAKVLREAGPRAKSDRQFRVRNGCITRRLRLAKPPARACSTTSKSSTTANAATRPWATCRRSPLKRSTPLNRLSPRPAPGVSRGHTNSCGVPDQVTLSVSSLTQRPKNAGKPRPLVYGTEGEDTLRKIGRVAVRSHAVDQLLVELVDDARRRHAPIARRS